MIKEASKNTNYFQLKHFVFLILIVCANKVSAQNINPADRILGKWISQQKNVIVQVHKDGKDEFGAKLLWFDDSDDPSVPMNARTDYKNPNKVLRNRKLIGMEVLDGLTYNPETNSWENGMIYDAKSGHTWNSAVVLDDDLLKVSGYWHFKFLGKTMVFKRM